MQQSLLTIDPRSFRWQRRDARHWLPRRRRERQLGDEAGLTLLEIMIVLAIIALIMGLVVGPMIMKQFGSARRELAAAAVAKIVNEAYPMWAQANPDKQCPASMEALLDFSNSKVNRDPWGKPYRLLCGPDAPTGVVGIAVVSNGPDQREGTEDDVKSW